MKVKRLLDQNPQLETLCSKVENTLILYIIVTMREKELSVQSAQMLAKQYLSLLPVNTQEDLFDKIYSLSLKYRQASYVYIEHAVPFYEDKRREALIAIRFYLKAGDIDNALIAAKGGGII